MRNKYYLGNEYRHPEKSKGKALKKMGDSEGAKHRLVKADKEYAEGKRHYGKWKVSK